MITDTDKNNIVAQLTDESDVVELLLALERRFPVRFAVVTKGDVNGEFQFLLEAEGKEIRDMTDDEWDKFASEWFWRKGHSEIMWNDIPNAIHWDLRQAGIVAPEEGSE